MRNCVRPELRNNRHGESKKIRLGLKAETVMNCSSIILLVMLSKKIHWRHDTQHNGIQYNDIQHNNIQHNDTQQNDIQHNDTQYNNIKHTDTQHN